MQASDWAGTVGEAWADEWPRTDRTFRPVDAALLAAVAARLEGIAAPRVLEIGCGAGTTALGLVERVPDARVTGIDLSPSLIAVARSRGDADGRCRFEPADAGRWDGEGGFDLVLSRHGVMFFDNPVAALAHIRTRAAPGAPLIFSCFRAAPLNPWATEVAGFPPAPDGDAPAPGPFAFADRAWVGAILAAAGWHAAEAVPLDFEYVAGGGADPVADALSFFARIGPAAARLRDSDDAARSALLSTMEAAIRARHVPGRVVFPAAAWIWRASA